MLFNEEVYNIDELIDKVVNDTTIHKMKVCVVCVLYDQDGKIILHRRGEKARDEVGKLQAIGGSINKVDSNFRDSMMREIREEGGRKVYRHHGRGILSV